MSEQPTEYVPEPTNAGAMMSAEQVQAMINAAVEQSEHRHEQEMSQLREDLAAAQAARAALITSTVPNHGGGVGTDINETWSQYDQTLAWRAAEAETAAKIAAEAQ